MRLTAGTRLGPLCRLVSGRLAARGRPDPPQVPAADLDCCGNVGSHVGKATTMRLLTMLPGGSPGYGRWSPDGRFIAYEAQAEGNWELWMVNPDDPYRHA